MLSSFSSSCRLPPRPFSHLTSLFYFSSSSSSSSCPPPTTAITATATATATATTTPPPPPPPPPEGGGAGEGEGGGGGGGGGRIPLDPDAVLDALSSYANDWPRALDFFRWSTSISSSPPSPAVLARMVDILGKHLEFPLALSLLPSSPPPDPLSLLPSFRSLFNRLAAARLLPDALSALRLALSLRLPSLPLSLLLLDSLCDRRLVADAESLFLLRPGPHSPTLLPIPVPIPIPADAGASTKVYNLLLRGWLKLRRFRRCRELWLEMDRKSVPKDLRSYSIYMDVLSKSGKPWNAAKLFREMTLKKSLRPDAVAYNTAIHAVGLSQGADSALRLYRQMADAGCPPNVATHNTVVKLLCREGRFGEAYSFVGRMKEHGCEPNALTYHCFFQHLSRPQEVLRLFEKMLERGCRPTTDTYVMLMKRFGRWGFLRPVFVVWNAMQEHGCCPDAFAYNALIDALLQKGMVETARKYDEEMLAKGLSPKPRKELGSRRSDDDDNVLSGVF